MIAALFVETGGVYFGLPNVEPFDVNRDARTYNGIYPVVAHPPCERWGRYWSGGPSGKVRKKKGDDDGCFQFALLSVRRCHGVLEHPEASHAWKAFNIIRPYRDGGWIIADEFGGWTCCVEQGHYGHPARKATWLYFIGPAKPPDLIWSSSGKRMQMEDGYHSKEERTLKHKFRKDSGFVERRLSKKQRLSTPLVFRDLLISLADLSNP